jgi:hypothetical protein
VPCTLRQDRRRNNSALQALVKDDVIVQSEMKQEEDMVTASEREIAFLSASELVDAYRRKTLSPVEVTKTVLARLERLEPKINAFVLLARDSALAEADAMALPLLFSKKGTTAAPRRLIRHVHFAARQRISDLRNSQAGCFQQFVLKIFYSDTPFKTRKGASSQSHRTPI